MYGLVGPNPFRGRGRKRHDVSHIADNDDHNSSNENDNFLLPSWEKNHMLRHCG